VPVAKQSDRADEALHIGLVTLEVAGLFFPPLAIAANDLKVFLDFYELLQQHASDTPGLAILPGPPLRVRNPGQL
jgi:hypothetical protein